MVLREGGCVRSRGGPSTSRGTTSIHREWGYNCGCNAGFLRQKREIFDVFPNAFGARWGRILKATILCSCPISGCWGGVGVSPPRLTPTERDQSQKIPPSPPCSEAKALFTFTSRSNSSIAAPSPGNCSFRPWKYFSFPE